jgi:hypothetical protein
VPDADDAAQNETDRKRALFAWALRVLVEAGLLDRIAAAMNLSELNAILLDLEAEEITLAVRAALHPVGGGKPAEHFAGLREGALKQVIKGRFDELKKARKKELEGEAPAAAEYIANPAVHIYQAIAKYIELAPHQLIAVTLWILHTHLYERFMVSPRLALISPIRGCGKTTLLDLCEWLAARGCRTDSITAPAIVRLVDTERATLLADEADNMDFAADRQLKAVLNGGHRKGAKRVLVVKGSVVKFSIYAPMAFAAIGMLPLPLMHRSITIEMSRATGPLAKFDASDPEIVRELLLTHAEAARWAEDATPALDPPLPKTLKNRPADNWRVLISIADCCSQEWGKFAREAAVVLTKFRPDEDPAVVLLGDIRDIFNRLKVDRLSSFTLVEELVAVEGGLWDDWRGLKDDRQPRRLSQGELARLLSPLKIKPRTVSPRGPRASRGKSSRGYFRDQFAEAWRIYCSSDAPTHGSKIKSLSDK